MNKADKELIIASVTRALIPLARRIQALEEHAGIGAKSWQPSQNFDAGMRVRHGGATWTCVQKHHGFEPGSSHHNVWRRD